MTVTTVGARLREAREKRGVPLRQIADRTRISVMALEAIERNDLKRLPGGIFTRAFLRAYAAEVGLDPDRTVQEFLAQFPHESVVIGMHGRAIEDNEAIESDRRIAETVVRLLVLSVPIAGAVIYFSYFGLRAPTAPASEPAPAPPAVSAPSAVEDPTPVVKRKPTEPPAGTEPAAKTAERPPVLAAEASETEPRPDALTMVIEPQADCWVSLTVDGQRVPSELLASGQRRELRAAREIVVTVGDGTACAYTLNGAAGRPLGGPGEVVTRRISVENYRDYLRSE